LELHITSPVPINNPNPGTCGILHSVYDSTWTNKLTVDLTFDWSGPSLGTCVRRDTVRMAVNSNSGIYNLICFGSAINNSVPPGVVYTRTVSDTVQVVVLNSTGIAEEAMEDVTIFPNPSSTYFELNMNGLVVDRVEIFDVKGSLIQSFNNIEDRIDVSKIENRIYFLRIHTNSGVISRKLMIAR